MSSCLQVTTLVGQLPAELRQLLPRPPVQNAAAAIDVYAHPAVSASGPPAALATEESPAALLANQLGATLPNRCRLFLREGPVCLSGCHVIRTQAYPAGSCQTFSNPVILLMRCCVAVAELEGLKTAVSRVNETARELLAATNPADAPMLKLNLREVITAAVLGKF